MALGAPLLRMIPDAIKVHVRPATPVRVALFSKLQEAFRQQLGI